MSDPHERRYAAEKRARLKARVRGAWDSDLIPHGRISGYAYWGCRCLKCTEANTESCKRTRQRRKARREAGG